jgi:aminocarboxymuconate-semialdehyde decarboxylase
MRKEVDMTNLYPLKIDVSAHILPPNYKEPLLDWLPPDSYWQHVRNIPTLFDLEHRFRTMDRFEDMVQVLTLQSPPVESIADPKKAVEFAKLANDEMAELVSKYPERFVAAIACLPMNNMDAALKETDRAIKDLKFRGVQIYSPINDKPLDSPEFMPLYEKMSRYNLPILLHPHRYQDIADYRTEEESKYLVYHIFGWPYETSAAMARLVFSGILEKFPNLKIIAHHNGAMVPFFESRICEQQYRRQMHRPAYKELTKPPIEYFKMFYADTAVSTVPTLMCTYHFFGAGYLLFGTDAPHGPQLGIRRTQQIINGIEQMDISDKEKQMIFEENTRRLLRLPL